MSWSKLLISRPTPTHNEGRVAILRWKLPADLRLTGRNGHNTEVSRPDLGSPDGANATGLAGNGSLTPGEDPPMTGLLLRRLVWLAPLLLLAGTTRPVPACDFCGLSSQTLTQEVNQAGMVLYGKLKNSRLAANPLEEGATGETDFEILDKIKDHTYLRGKQEITIPRYIPTGRTDTTRWLIFCEIYKNKLDPYRGMPVRKTSDLPGYLKGALAVREKKLPERLKFFFRYLQNEDFEIANDALKEFGNASYADVVQIADALPSDTIAGWLADKQTPAHRIGLYSLLLGLCSKEKEKHARLLRGLIDDPDRQLTGGVDGILASQVLLQPKEGWEYLRSVLMDRKRGFLVRYAALRAARFFIDTRKDVIQRNNVIDAVSLLLEHTDIADLAIDVLSRWKCLNRTKKV